MSSSSLSSIYSGRDISENMLFRIQRYLEGVSRSERRNREQFDETGKWRLVTAPSVQAELAKVSSSLVRLCDALSASNSVGSTNSAISSLQKKQLVAMLKSMIESLEAPAVSEKQASTLFRWIGRILKRGAKAKLEESFSEALGQAADLGAEFVETLSNQPGVMDFDLM